MALIYHYHTGRKAFSITLRNSVHFLHMDKFSTKELECLAEGYGLAYPKASVAAFNQAQKNYPNSANTRTLFTLFKTTKQKKSVEESVEAVLAKESL